MSWVKRKECTLVVDERSLKHRKRKTYSRKERIRKHGCGTQQLAILSCNLCLYVFFVLPLCDFFSVTLE